MRARLRFHSKWSSLSQCYRGRISSESFNLNLVCHIVGFDLGYHHHWSHLTSSLRHEYYIHYQCFAYIYSMNNYRLLHTDQKREKANKSTPDPLPTRSIGLHRDISAGIHIPRATRSKLTLRHGSPGRGSAALDRGARGDPRARGREAHRQNH